MSKRDLQKFGKRLKFLRLDKELTQLELAEILDMSPNFIGMIERGERNTTVENVFKIFLILNRPPYYKIIPLNSSSISTKIF